MNFSKSHKVLICSIGVAIVMGYTLKPFLPPIKGINLSYIDSNVNIHDDFYRFAVGNWMKKNPVPATESSWGSFNEVTERNKAILKEIFEEAQKSNAAQGSNKQKIGDYYKSGMDSVLLNKMGVKPLLPYFKEIQALNDKNQLVNWLGKMQAKGQGILFYLYAGQDDKNSSQIVPQIWQGGTSLPDRDFYLKDKFKEIRAEYVKHVTKMLELAGEKHAQAAKNADLILAMETQLAEASMARVDMRDPYKLYNKRSWKQMNEMTPVFDWSKHAALCGVPACDSIIIAQPEFMAAMSKMIENRPMNEWKIYLKWHVLRGAAGYLSDKIGDENFHFNATILNGTKQRKARWERVLREVEGSMGEAVGELYVAKAFKPEAKARMLKLVRNLQGVFKERIQKLDWMSAETKQKAVLKLDKITVKIGYPDKFKSYKALNITKNNYFENVLASGQFEYNRMMAKIGKPVDKLEWGMNPQTVNAYYNPGMNEIVFPAGILQPPFFDMEADDATVYGAIGAVIGHEMTHGFDDQGRQYDAEGNLKDWWTKEDADKFEAKANVVVEQFNGYKVLDTVSVNGKLTTGENLADLGGLSIAYDAFKRTEQGKGNVKIDGLTPDQRFFLSWASAWKNNTTNEAILQQIMTDPHSPEEWRCNGPITHMEAFYKAFNIKEDGKMFRPVANRVNIW